MKRRVVNLVNIHLNDDEITLQKPKKEAFGHYAVPVFKYAKTANKNPQEYAQELSLKLSEHDEFESVESIGGFINFKLSDALMDEMANLALEKRRDFGKGEEGKRILLEYISANPTGPLHIGHARGAIFGDALLRIGRHLGYQITSEYYVNDAGNQVKLLGLSLFLSAKECLDMDVEWPEEYYRGEYIKDLALLAVEEFGKGAFENEDLIETLSLWGTEKMLELIKEDISALSVTPFDIWSSEKALYTQWGEIKERLNENSALYEKEGKIWLKSSEKKDEKDRVVVRENGIPTYLAGDIIYHAHKFDQNFDEYINIWGADHHGYIARVKAAVEFLGYDKEKLTVLLSQMVNLLKGGVPYKMSKRAGNFILVKDVVDEIGSDALRLVFLTKKADTPLEFDVDDLSKADASNPAFYVNYAHARVYSIFTKIGKSFEDINEVKLESLESAEKDLLFYALSLPYELEDAFIHYEPHRVTNFLYTLASMFHKFYNAYKVVGDEREEIRLKIFAVVATILDVGLYLLGVESKKRM